MEILFSNSQNLLNQAENKFFRYLFDKIDWNQRMIAIKGPRGSGKTTLMLQRIKYGIKPQANESLYFSADHYWFYTHNLVETANTFYQNGGRFLFIDEVHKYPNWSRELKNIYDSYPDLKVVFSSSSALDIYRGESDLSRRVITYELPGMSFREYLNLTQEQNIHPVSLAEIQTVHSQITPEITSKLQPLPAFKEYLKRGYLPIITESNPETIPVFLQQIINTVVESDLAFIADYNAGTAYKVKKLLGVLAESVPFKPNVSSIARKVETSRDSVYEWLTQLEKARLLNFLIAEGKGVSLLQKPDKVYLENTNLSYALGVLYVIEGSTLGGKIITNLLKRQLNLVDYSEVSYFNSYGDITDEMWNNFKKYIATSEEFIDKNEMILGAKDTFEALRIWLLEN